MLEVRDFEAHQVVKPSRLEHVFHLLGQGCDLRISFVLAHMVEQVVKDVTNHLDLLLTLKIVVSLSRPLIPHELLVPLSLHPLNVAENGIDARA